MSIYYKEVVVLTGKICVAFFYKAKQMNKNQIKNKMKGTK